MYKMHMDMVPNLSKVTRLHPSFKTKLQCIILFNVKKACILYTSVFKQHLSTWN